VRAAGAGTAAWQCWLDMIDRGLDEPDKVSPSWHVRALVGGLVRVAVLFALTALLAKYTQPPIPR
jgi:hypothetical protein